MRAYLEVIHGRYGGTTIGLDPGDVCRIGRTGKADIFFPDDPFMAPLHFTITNAGDQCFLYDLNSPNGVLVNEKKVVSSALQHGDRVFAGITEFNVYIAGKETNGAEPVTPLCRIRDYLLQSQESLFLIVDTARDQELLPWLQSTRQPIVSLYQGERQEQLANVAPYLMQVAPEKNLLDMVLRRVWGKSCGTWFSSNQSIESLRRHFRHFLMVQDVEGQEMYFRFYDPRILRGFLPACLPGEIEQFFGPINKFFTEDRETYRLLQFSHSDGRLEQEVMEFRTEDMRVFKALLARIAAGV